MKVILNCVLIWLSYLSYNIYYVLVNFIKINKKFNSIAIRLLPKIKQEFPRQSLRYRLIVTLNETSDDILEMATIDNRRNVLLNLSERELWLITVTPVILLFVVFVMVDSLLHWYI